MKKIIVIEDDVALGDVLDQKLRAHGYDSEVFRDGRQGFDAVAATTPDLILLDIILPSMNGYEILEAKQKNKDIKDIPVIVISNSGQPVEINRTMELGVKDYIIKANFDVNEVLSKVDAQFKGPAEKAEVDTSSVSLAGTKIIWVEDDQFLSDLIARKLTSEKCDLKMISSGEEALRVLESEKPDIILLDILLPGISGYEVLEQLKKNENTKNIPVVLFSNFGQKTDVEKGEKLGAERFVLKAAISLEEMVNILKQILAKKK
jgi:DNA-binding response OmpR family regulator